MDARLAGHALGLDKDLVSSSTALISQLMVCNNKSLGDTVYRAVTKDDAYGGNAFNSCATAHLVLFPDNCK